MIQLTMVGVEAPRLLKRSLPRLYCRCRCRRSRRCRRGRGGRGCGSDGAVTTMCLIITPQACTIY